MGFGVRGMGILSPEIYKEMSLQATDWDSWRRRRARIRFSVKIGDTNEPLDTRASSAAVHRVGDLLLRRDDG